MVLKPPAATREIKWMRDVMEGMPSHKTGPVATGPVMKSNGWTSLDYQMRSRKRVRGPLAELGVVKRLRPTPTVRMTTSGPL